MNRFIASCSLVALCVFSPLGAASNGGSHPTLTEFLSLHTQGVNHELGRGVPQSFAKAARWYLEAAKLGFADSQYDLAKLYEDGRGVDRDPARAYLWYTLAAEQGNEVAARDRASLLERISAAERVRGESLLFEWRTSPEGRGVPNRE